MTSEAGALWLVSGPASVLAEPIPAGVLTPNAILRQPPAMIAAAEILPENLPDAWSEGQARHAHILPLSRPPRSRKTPGLPGPVRPTARTS